MATNNSQNSGFDNNSDGFDISGGTTARKLTVTGGDMTMTGAGSNTYTFPSSTDTLLGASSLPSGIIWAFAAVTAPTGWLLCDGTAVSRTTYSALFSAIAPSKGTFTVTIASPAVVTLTAHGMATGDAVYLTTTGALPTGLSANTLYYVIMIDANTFNLATSRANALAGTKINTSGSQSGTHSLNFCPYGLGDGSTTFNVPNLSGNVGVGSSSGDSNFGNLGNTGGEKTHILVTAEMPSHSHTQALGGALTTYLPQSGGGVGGKSNSQGVSATGGDGAHNNLQPFNVINYIIKT